MSCDLKRRHELDQAEAKHDAIIGEMFSRELSLDYVDIEHYGDALMIVQEQPRAAANLLYHLAMATTSGKHVEALRRL